MQSINQVLRDKFGYTSFREGQESIINAILSHQNVFRHHADWRRKICMLSAPALVVRRSDISYFTIDFIDERSSRCIE